MSIGAFPTTDSSGFSAVRFAVHARNSVTVFGLFALQNKKNLHMPESLPLIQNL
jgi:hypothetical protein